MPYNPALPANGSLIAAAELRSQFTPLNADIQDRATHAELSSDIGGTSSNSNGVGNLSLSVSDPPTQGEVQTIADKLDELINALRR